MPSSRAIRQETAHRKRKWAASTKNISATAHDTNEHMAPTSANENEKKMHQAHVNPPEYLKTIRQEKLNTWISPNGKQKRQIDYILTNRKYRNAATRTWAEQGWRGNMHQSRQHSVIRMDITRKLTQRYHNPYIRATGKHIKYDIEQLKIQPAKLAKWYKQRKETPGNMEPEIKLLTNKDYGGKTQEQLTTEVIQEWRQLQGKCTQDSRNVTHRRKKEIQQRKLQNQQNRFRQWGTKTEQQEAETWQNKKRALQKILTQRDGKIKKAHRNIELTRTLQAWKLFIDIKKKDQAKIEYQTEMPPKQMWEMAKKNYTYQDTWITRTGQRIKGKWYINIQKMKHTENARKNVY